MSDKDIQAEPCPPRLDLDARVQGAEWHNRPFESWVIEKMIREVYDPIVVLVGHHIVYNNSHGIQEISSAETLMFSHQAMGILFPGKPDKDGDSLSLTLMGILATIPPTQRLAAIARWKMWMAEWEEVVDNEPKAK